MATTPKPIKKTATKPAAKTAVAIAAKPRAVPLVGAGKTNTKPAAPKTSKPATTPAKAAPAPTLPALVAAVEKPALATTRSGDVSNVSALKKKDLIDQVLAKTGAKKKLVKDVVEATLTVLGDALSKGAMLNLPPFGKAKVSRPQVAGTGNAMTVKVRRTTGGGQGGAKSKQALADAEE